MAPMCSSNMHIFGPNMRFKMLKNSQSVLYIIQTVQLYLFITFDIFKVLLQFILYIQCVLGIFYIKQYTYNTIIFIQIISISFTYLDLLDIII